MSYEQRIIDEVRMPPRDAGEEMKIGKGFNVGYERDEYKAQVERLVEGLRKAVNWAECCAIKLDGSVRKEMNWRTIHEAKALLAECEKGARDD